MKKSLIIVVLVILIVGGTLYYLSLPKQIGKELNYPNLISCIDLDGDNMNIKSRSEYIHTKGGPGENDLGGSIEDYCDVSNMINNKAPQKEAICEGQDSYFIIRTCGWFGECVDGRCI